MAKYTINHTCGHQSIVNIVGTNVHGERERKAAYLETLECSECKAKAAAGDAEIVEMHYSEYKNNYAACKTVPSSYDKYNKTIKVYVPREAEADTTDSAPTIIYNVSQIMSNAWAIYKASKSNSTNISFGEALKKSWAEAKAAAAKLRKNNREAEFRSEMDALGYFPEDGIKYVLENGSKLYIEKLEYGKENFVTEKGKAEVVKLERAVEIMKKYGY